MKLTRSAVNVYVAIDGKGIAFSKSNSTSLNLGVGKHRIYMHAYGSPGQTRTVTLSNGISREWTIKIDADGAEAKLGKFTIH